MLSQASDKPRTHRDWRMKAENWASIGLNDSALVCYREAARLARLAGDDIARADILNSISGIYIYEGQFKPAEKLLMEARSTLRARNDSLRLRKVINNLGLLYSRNADYAAANDCFRQALSLCGTDSIDRGSILINIADMDMSRGYYTQAYETLRHSLHLFGTSRRGTTGRIQAILNCALIETQRGNAAKARRLVAEARPLLPGADRRRLPDNYSQIADIHLNLGDSLQALRDILAYEAIHDSIENEKSREQVRRFVVAYDAERLEQNNRMLMLSMEKRNLYVVLSLVIILAMGVFAFMLWRRNVQQRHSNAIIVNQRQQLLEYEREAHERETRQLGMEIDEKKRRLTSFAIDLAAINELKARLAETLDKARRSLRAGDAQEASGLIGDAMNRLSLHGESAVSDDFRVYFEEVHPEFFSRLKERFPALTQNDLRLCAFLQLGMTTKEIAALIHREVRSVESSRLRLRKKLSVPSETSLADFLTETTGINQD